MWHSGREEQEEEEEELQSTLGFIGTGPVQVSWKLGFDYSFSGLC